MFRPSYLLGKIVDELPVDEDVDSVVNDLLALFTHLVLLCLLDLSHLVIFFLFIFFSKKNSLFSIVGVIS